MYFSLGATGAARRHGRVGEGVRRHRPREGRGRGHRQGEEDSFFRGPRHPCEALDSWQKCCCWIVDSPKSQRNNFNRLLITDYNYERLAFHVLFNAYVSSLLQITINRPNRRNDFRPLTVKELMLPFNDARDDSSIGVIILTGREGTTTTDARDDSSKKKKSISASMEDNGAGFARCRCRR